MSSIDKRIVQMQFDNQNFESGVSKTMSSLKKLNESLKMKGSSEGLDSVNKGISKLSANGMSGLSSGVETVTAKFSALGVIGMTALANITNSAVNAGKKLVKSLTVDPIMTGFSEYETKMGSIQTILANTAHHGTTLEDVNKALGDLNTYSDKTIYNFAEMAKNIGTFTAAGIDLDTSTAAIKGIANLAAVSGSTSQQASTAMYQLSQALAAGRVSLADWNSVVNAGMGGKLFQDALIRTSEHLGTGAENMIKKYGSFRESLTKGEWMTSEVLTETLKQLSGAYTEADLIAQGYTKSQAKEIMELAKTGEAAATEVKTFTQLMDTMKESVQSGWAQSWEYIIGDKEQATEFLTGISKGFESIIKPSTDARNEMLKFWNENGGRDDVIKGFTNIFQSLGKGFKSIGEAWKEVFPPMTGKKLTELSEKFKNFTEKIKMSDDTAKKIKDTFKGVFNVFKTVGSAIGNVVKAFSPLLGALKPIGSAVLSATAGIGNFITKISEAAANSKIFTKIADGIKSAFENIGDFLGTVGDKIRNFFSGMSGMDFSGITNFVSGVFTTIGGVLSSIGSGIGKALGTINFETLSNIVKSLLGFGVLKSLKGIFDKISGVGDGLSGVFESFSGIGENVKDVLDSTKEALTSWQNSLNAGTLMKLAGAIAILAGSLLLLASIEPTKLATALAGMAGLFAEMSLAMLAIDKIGNIKGLMKTSTGMILIATAMLILSSAMKKLSGLNVGEVVTGLAAMAGLLVMMAASVKLFSTSSKGLIKTAAGLIIFGAAMQVMGSALKKLGEIDPDTLGSGLLALAGVLTELALFLAAAKFGSLGITDSVGILVLSASLLVLSQAVKQFGSLDTDQIIRGLAGIAGMLAEIAIFSKLSGSGLGMIATAAGLAAMSAAMLVMAAAMKSFATIQWEEIARGLTAMAGGLLIFGAAAYLVNGGMLLLLAVGVAAMSASLLILSAALKSLAGMTWEEIGKGLLVLAGALTILGVAMYAMTGAIVGAAAMLVMAGALAILTPQLLLLGQMSLAEIGSALLMLAGAFTVLGVAGLLLTPIAPVLLILGAAIGLIGVGCLAAGVGITAFATGLGLVAAAVTASGGAIVDFIKDLLNLLPQLGTKAGEAMVNFATAIGNGHSAVIGAFTKVMTALLDSVTKLAPKIAQTGVTLITEFAKALATGIPKLVSCGMEMIVGILKGIAANIGNVVKAAADIIVNFINGIAANLGNVINAGINLALSFIEGVANGISSNSGRLEAAIRSVIQAMAQAGLAVIRGAISGFTSGGKTLLQGFCNGVKSMMGSAGSAVKGCVNSAKRAASGLGSALVGAGRSMIQGLISGISSMASAVASKARSIVQGAVRAAKAALKINSPSKVFIEIGKFVDQGFVVGMDKYSKKVNNSATNLAEGVIDNIKNPLSHMAALVNGEIDANPTITPVLDLSNVERNSRRIGDLVSGNGTLSLSTDNANLMTKSIGQIQNGPDNSDIVSALKDLKASMADNRPSYTVNGITYDDGSNITSAVETLVRAAKIERRI